MDGKNRFGGVSLREGFIIQGEHGRILGDNFVGHALFYGHSG
jgi:hypothetical protein